MIIIKRLTDVLLAVLVGAFISVSVYSCAVTQDSLVDDKKLTICATPKPEACTREYKPVCGFESDGNYKTFSNACTACSSPEISSYDNGACK